MKNPTLVASLGLALLGCGAGEPEAVPGSGVVASVSPCEPAGTGNLVPNGAFDQVPGAWTKGSIGDDASGCVASSSLALTAERVDDESLLLANSQSPCFKLAAGHEHRFGASLKKHEGAAVSCFLLLWNTPNGCEQNVPGETRSESVDNGLSEVDTWERSKVVLAADMTDGWARVNCRTDGQGFVDDVFVLDAH
jgi:hypothetical protein